MDAIAAEPSGVTSSLRAQALEGLARSAIAQGDVVGGTQRIAEALKLPRRRQRAPAARGLAFSLAHAGPAGPALREYSFPTKETDSLALTEAAVAAEPTLGQAHYLLGLQRGIRDDWAGAAAALSKALELGLPGIAFVKNAARRLALVAYRANDRAGVERAIAVLSRPEMATGDQMLATDWRERLAFESSGSVGARSAPQPRAE